MTTIAGTRPSKSALATNRKAHGVASHEEASVDAIESSRFDAVGTSPYAKEEVDRRLDAAGWKSGTIAEFLGMTVEEAFLMAVHGDLRHLLRHARKRTGLTQAEIADRIGSSQPRIAKLESSDRKATIDLLMRAAFAAGATPAETAGIFTAAAEYAEAHALTLAANAAAAATE